MAVEIHRSAVELDTQQARSQLKELQAQATKMRKELKEMKLSKDPGYADKKREFESLRARIDRAKKSSFDLNATLRNLSGATMKDLQRAQRVLSAQIANTSRTTQEGRAAFAQKTEQLRRVRAEMTQVNNQMRGLNQNMNIVQRGAQAFNKYFGMIGAGMATVAGVIMGFRKTIGVFNDFEESVANLSAITGLTGEQLQWLAERAQQASIMTDESGIRFKNSAKDIVDAYTMVGSKRPELLANREALAQVTEQAMILSRAAKIELAPAAEALTTTMNQYNASAQEAARIINVLGAGSKVGAANVAYLNNVVEKTGTSARGAGLSIEQLVGTIEGIAPRFSEPAEAGTSLRNVLLRLQALDDDLNPTIVGWDKALENLAARQYSAAELTNIFGLRAVNMVQALVDGRQDIIRFTDAVTGSSVAIEQAAINSDTNAAKLDQARNKAQLLRIELGEKLAPALTFSTNGFSYLLKALRISIDFFSKHKEVIIPLTRALLAYVAAKQLATLWEGLHTKGVWVNNAAMKAKALLFKSGRTAVLLYAGAKAILTGNITRARAAMELLRRTLARNPYTAMLTALTALTAGVVTYIRRLREKSHLEQAQKRVQKSTEQDYDRQALAVTRLVRLIEQENASLESRRKAIEELKKIMPEYNGLLSDEGKLVNHNKVTIDQYLESLRESVRLRVLSEELDDLFVQEKAAERAVTQAMSKMEKAEEELRWVREELKDRSAEMLADTMVSAANRELSKAKKTLEGIRAAITALSKGDDAKSLLPGSSDNNENTEDPDIPDADLDPVTNAYRELTQAISNARAELEHFVAIGDYSSAQLADVQIKNLEAQKLVMDGLIAAGGDVLQFLDDMADSTQAELQEMEQFNQQFLQQWKVQSDEWQQEKDLRRQEEMQKEAEASEQRIRLYQMEAEVRMELERQWGQMRGEVMDHALAHGFQLFSAYAYAEQDRRLNDLSIRRDRELSNENLTQEQRLAISERYQREEAQIKREAFIRQRRADVVQSTINTLIAISRALAAPPGFPLNAPSVTLAGVLGAMQTAAILGQPVPQFARGRYFTVKGQSDGKTYTAPWMGTPITGLYSGPALVAEKGEELIVDAPTTRNIRMNYPHLLSAIMAARVPQYAQGKYPQGSSESVREDPMGISMSMAQDIGKLKESVDTLSLWAEKLLKEGVHGVWVYSDLARLQQKVQQMEDQTRL